MRPTIALAIIISAVVTVVECTQYKLETPAIKLGNGSNSPAQLEMQLDTGATGYYSHNGSYPTLRYDPSNPPVFYDNISIKALQRENGYIDSDMVSQSFVVGHVMADSRYRAPDGPPGSWTTRGNDYTLTLAQVRGNGTDNSNNTQVTLAISFTGAVGGSWSGVELNNNIALVSTTLGTGSVVLTFGDGSSTLFAQVGPNPSGIYEFDIQVGTVSFRVLLPLTYLPSWTNPSP